MTPFETIMHAHPDLTLRVQPSVDLLIDVVRAPWQDATGLTLTSPSGCSGQSFGARHAGGRHPPELVCPRGPNLGWAYRRAIRTRPDLAHRKEPTVCCLSPVNHHESCDTESSFPMKTQPGIAQNPRHSGTRGACAGEPQTALSWSETVSGTMKTV